MDLLAPWREGPYTLQEALERYGEALVGEALRQQVGGQAGLGKTM